MNGTDLDPQGSDPLLRERGGLSPGEDTALRTELHRGWHRWGDEVRRAAAAAAAHRQELARELGVPDDYRPEPVAWPVDGWAFPSVQALRNGGHAQTGR